ncbi:MAG: class I SAM-dependent methyltransferase [Alphaproteobacteria bacterium]
MQHITHVNSPMLTPDILKLKAFYATPLGELAHGLILRSILRVWPHARGESVLGIGYTTPYMAEYLDDGALLAACMPSYQGAAYWPANRTNLTFLANESELPIRESTMNRVLLVHSIETTDQLHTMLRDVWRVLTPGGRVLVVAPNRLSMWARSSRSPFGFGLPFSMAQLKTLLAEHDFTVMHAASALYIPPLHNRLLWKVARRIDALGQLLCVNIGGVILVEAEKQIYAGVQQPAATRNYKKAPAAKPVMTMTGN